MYIKYHPRLYISPTLLLLVSSTFQLYIPLRKKTKNGEVEINGISFWQTVSVVTKLIFNFYLVFQIFLIFIFLKKESTKR